MLAPKKNLAINKGNSKKYKLQLLDQNDNIILFEKDIMVYFTVKEDPYSIDYVFQKRLGNGISFSEETNMYIIEIFVEDTDSLFYKDYFYDIAIVRNAGLESANKKEKTTVLVGNFTVEHVATLKINEVDE